MSSISFDAGDLKVLSSKSTVREVDEQRFHDEKYSNMVSHSPLHYLLNPTYFIFLEMKKQLGDLAGKSVLEYGCGDGWVTAELASMGGSVTAFDISAEAVKVTRDHLARRGLTGHSTIIQSNAERLDFHDESFETICGFAILHHLDLEIAIPELMRVLKRGGRAIFAEPLDSNIFINLYRKLTPQFRTKDEKPISLKYFSNYRKYFIDIKFRVYFLFAIIPMALCYVFSDKLVARLLPKCIKLDNLVLNRSSIIDKLAWYAIIVMQK